MDQMKIYIKNGLQLPHVFPATSRYYGLVLLLFLMTFQGTNVNAQNYDSDDLLYAIAKSDLNQLKRYNELNPAYFRKAASVILVPAVNVGDIDVVRYLIKNGADVNYELGEETPLIVAAEWADYEMIELLCQYGAKVSKTGGLGKPKLTLMAMETVFESRNMTAGKKERKGVTRSFTLHDIKRSLAVLSRYR